MTLRLNSWKIIENGEPPIRDLRHARHEGIGLKDLAPHDLRQACSKLCRKWGGDPEQIQMLLGHASIQTSKKYLGTQQNLVEALNDKLGIVDADF
jgi:integrase/recombinase XerD